MGSLLHCTTGKKKMKIGIVVDSVNVSSGGAYSFFEKLLHDLKSVETEHEFIIFHRAGKPEFNNGILNSFTWVPIRSFTLFDRIIRKMLRIVNHIRILFNLPSPLDLTHVGHRLFPYLPEEQLHHAYVEYIFIPFLPKAFRIIIGNEAGKQQLLRFYPIQPEIIRTIPLPVYDLPDTEPAESRSDFPLPERPFVFYPAQFWPHKNHITLIKAIHILRQRNHLKIDVVLTGSDKGNRENVIRQIADHDLKDQFHLPGIVSRATMRLLYTKTLALTYTSILGPDNMPPLEAMNLKCPVICARYDGANEQLGNAALFFEPFDAEKLANHILTLYQNSELKNTLIREGCALAEQRKFNYAEKLLRIAEEFIPYLSFWK